MCSENVNREPAIGEYLLTFSASTQSSLERQLQMFQTFLQTKPNLRDVSYSLLQRRDHYEWRKALVVKPGDSINLKGGVRTKGNRAVFLFPGQVS